MSDPDNRFKHRIVGALVLIALAIIFLPMLFKTDEEHSLPQVNVQAPAMPNIPAPPQYPVESVTLPEPITQPEPVPYSPELPPSPEEAQQGEIIHTPAAVEPAPVVLTPEPVTPPAPVVTPKPVMVETPKPVPAPVVPAAPTPPPAKPVTPAKPAAPANVAPGIDRNNLPVSWALQLASLQSLPNAQALRDKYRSKHYSAYVRSADGVHKVFIGPLIREAEAQAMCKQLKTRDGQECFVTRYQP